MSYGEEEMFPSAGRTMYFFFYFFGEVGPSLGDIGGGGSRPASSTGRQSGMGDKAQRDRGLIPCVFSFGR